MMQDAPESYRQWFKDESEFLRRNVRKLNSVILDVGCGDGRTLYSLLRLGGFLYGVDNDIVAVEKARRSLNNPFITILHREAKNLGFHDNIFDYVLAMNVAGNFGKDRNQIYSEMRRVLKPEGELVLSVFNEDALDERIKVYRAHNMPIKRIEGATVVFDCAEGEHYSEQYSELQLRQLFQENRLIPIEIEKQGIGYLCRLKK
jgi:SAM-dependent methyltransferase